MSISANVTLGSNATTAASSSIVLTTTSTAPVGDCIIVAVAVDNVGTTDADNAGEVTSVTDSAGNTYVSDWQFRNGQGAADAGAYVAVYRAKVTTQLTSGGTITANFSESQAVKAISAFCFATTADLGFVVAATPGTLADDAGDSGSMTISGLASGDYLLVRATASEAATTSPWTNTVGYSGFTPGYADTGTAATSMRIEAEYILVTGGTGGTSDPTSGGSRDRASIFIAYREAIAYTLAAGTGSFALTGVAAGLKAARKVVAATGSFALTGVDAGLRAARKIDSGVGSFTLTGQAAGMRATRTISAAAGSFTVTGQAATFHRSAPAGVGTFALTGQDASLRVTARVLPVASGAFTLTGQASTLRAARRLSADTGVYLFNGGATGLSYQQLAHRRVRFSTTGHRNVFAANKVDGIAGEVSYTFIRHTISGGSS